MDETPDPESFSLVEADPDKRAVVVGGGREPPYLMDVEPPGLGELELVNTARRPFVWRQEFRVAQDHPERHRPLFFVQQAGLVASGDHGLKRALLGQRTGPLLVPRTANEAGEVRRVRVRGALPDLFHGTHSIPPRAQAEISCRPDR